MKKFFSFSKKKKPPGGDSPVGGATAPVPNTDAGYEVREKDLPKLHKAAWTGDIAKVQQLVRKDPSALDKDNRTALHLACVQGNTQVVQTLLEWKAKSNIGDNQAKTPLIKAVECGKEDCVILLLQHRADIGAKDCDGNSALHHAIKHNYPALVRVLIKGGANVNLKNKDGYAPLHFAILEKRDELTRILLAEKADPDIQDANGRTPMMLACYEGLITPVRLLLQSKANVVIKDKKGFTAEDIANMTGQHACTQLLSDHLTKLRRSTSGSSIQNTPRAASSLGTNSAATTPRNADPSLSAMLPAANVEPDDSDDDQTLSRQSTHDKGDDSWDDSVSLGIDVKRKGRRPPLPESFMMRFDSGSDIEGDMPEEDGAPKVSLAKALKNTLPSDSVSDDGGGDTHPVDDDEEEEEEEEDEMVDDNDADNRNASRNQEIFRGKQSSSKSQESATSIEEDWSDDEQSPSKKANGTPRVSFKADDDIKEMTAEEDTSIDDEDNTESAAKRPKLDMNNGALTGYIPTGVTPDPLPAMDKERQRADQVPNPVEKQALMDELGISDPSDISDLSDMDDDPPLPLQQSPPATKVSSASVKTPSTEKDEEKEDDEDDNVDDKDSEWGSSGPSLEPTPRPGILKNWKQHSQEQVLKKKENTSKSEDVSEWDSDLENQLDPVNPPSVREDIEVEGPGLTYRESISPYEQNARANKYMTSPGSDDFNDTVTSDMEEVATSRRKAAEMRDAGLRGIDDSPIVLDYHHSHSEDVLTDSFERADDLHPSKAVTLLEEEEDSRSNSPQKMQNKMEQVTQGHIDVVSRHSDDPEIDQEVARVLAVEEFSQIQSSSLEQRSANKEGDDNSQNTMEHVPSDEEVADFDSLDFSQHFHGTQKDQVEDFVAEESSQWDSTNSGLTPRRPEVQKSDVKDDKVDDLDEEDEEDEVRPTSTEAMYLTASFGSGTTQQTVIERKVKELQKEEGEEEDDEDSDWDSEDEGMLPSETNAPPVYMPNFGTEKAEQVMGDQSHSASKGEHSVTEDVEEESISEWEIERMKEKAQKHQSEAEEENRRLIEKEAAEQAEHEAEILRQQKAEAERENELQRLREEEAERQAEILRHQRAEAERQADLLRQQEEAEQAEELLRLQEEEARIQAEMIRQQEEAEHLRQMEWEEQQREQEERLRREAEEEAKREEADLMASDHSDEERTTILDQSTSPRSPDSISFPKKKSPEPKQKTSTPVKKSDVKLTTATSSLEENVTPVTEDVIEVTTSFGVRAGHPTTTDPRPDLKRDTDLHGQQKPPSDGTPSFDQSHSIGVTSFSRSPAPHKTRPSPTITTTHPNMHSDGMSVDDDDSVDLDFDRADMGTYLRGLPSSSYGYGYKGLDLPDDDVLSYTSTENGDSMVYQTSIPYGKDVLANMNLSDPGAVLKLQDYMHDQNKRLDQERNHRMALENKHRSMAKEKNELNKKVEALSKSKSSLEQLKLDLEQKIRNLEYNLNEEAEIRKNSETLLAKTKEQLSRKEEQYTGEIEAKQKAELQMRNLQIELRSATNSVKALEDEKIDLQRQLQNEKNARHLQEQLNEDQQKIQHVLQEEQLRSSLEKNEAEHKLESADENRKAVTESLHKLKAENNAIRMELEKQRMRHRDEVAMLSAENEELHSKIEELKNDIKLNEEALSHASMQYQLQLSNVRTESTVISSVLEKERSSREKVEAELESVKTRLHTSMLEVDKAEQARSEIERRLQHDLEEWTHQSDVKDREISSLKDSTQGLLQRLQTLDSKLTALESELHISNTTLLERSNQLQQAQKDLHYYKGAQENFDTNYKLEKEMNNKLQAKNEQLQEKVTGIQHENLSLRQQLETTQHALLEKGGDSKTDQYNAIIASMKTDHEKSRAIWEERNTSLSDQCTRLKEENRNLEARRNKLEEELERKEKENSENLRKLLRVEAQQESLDTKRSELEAQKTQYRMEGEVYKEKMEKLKSENQDLQTKLSSLQADLQRTKDKNEANTEKLLHNSANMEAFSKSKGELEENYQQLKLDNAKMEAELKHERQKSEMLHKDLQDSQKVRSSLEALCANLKSTNAHLEDKLTHGAPSELDSNEESTTKSLLTQEAEENKDMWEKEVISRSKLGLRIATYEKSKQEAFNQLEEERRKHRKSLEQKKAAETKLEAEIEKNTQLQKEVSTLKAYLKVAKKRLKGVDGQDSRLGTLNADFERERFTMESTLSSVRQQLLDLQSQLEHEVEGKEKLQARIANLQGELVVMKRLEKNYEKLKVAKAKVDEEYRLLQNKMENGYVDKEDLERAKREMEARYRLELNRKLEDVNNYLEEQARARERLDVSRDETEYKLKDDRKKIQDENTALRIKYEQAVAQKESKEMEVKRYKELYESEMQWRMRLSNQLLSQADKAFNYKSKLVVERQRNRTLNNLSNLTFSGTLNGQVLDVSRLSTTVDDLFQSKLKAELDRSINKHLEAAPHDSYEPVLRSTDDGALNTSYAKSNAEYLETLKRKYCV